MRFDFKLVCQLVHPHRVNSRSECRIEYWADEGLVLGRLSRSLQAQPEQPIDRLAKTEILPFPKILNRLCKFIVNGKRRSHSHSIWHHKLMSIDICAWELSM